MSTTSLVSKTYWKHAWKYPWHVLGVLITLPINVLAEQFVGPYVTALILDKIAQGQTDFHAFWPLFIIIAAAEVYAVVMWRFTVYLLWRLETHVMYDLADESFQYLMNQSYNFHANSFSGALVSYVSKYINAYAQLADTISFNMYRTICVYIFTIVLLINRAPFFVIAMLVVSVIYTVVMVKIKRKELEQNQDVARKESTQVGQLADSITNILTAKSYSGEGHELGLFNKTSEDVRQSTQKLINISNKNDLIGSSLIRGVFFIAIIAAVYAVTAGKTSLGTILLVVTYSGIIMDRLWGFSSSFKQINRSIGNASDMVNMLQREPSVKDAENAERPVIKHGRLTFKNVDFTYEDSKNPRQIFKDLSFTIPHGQKVGLVGPSGGGKSTITKLLLRYIDINGGAITIDGQNIASIKQSDLRSFISYVSQEPLLFHRSIYDNIRYSKPNATRREIMAAAKKAHVDTFVDRLADGYETIVGERGVKLSGGEKQRVAIARAILKDAPILVLDEATSALDSESEKLIQDALTKLMEKKTAIVIAHRLSTIQRLDRIIVLANGEVVEDGTHKELVANKKGTYSKLWNHQTGGFIED